MKLFIKLLVVLSFVSVLILNDSCSSNERGSREAEQLLDNYRQIRFKDNQSLEQFLENILRHYRIPGIAAAIVSKDSILKIGAVGKRKSDSEKNIEIDDLFCIGSCTKSMTAALAAMLVEDGILNWSTRIFDVFPELNSEGNNQFQKTTLKDLLSHQAGIQPYYSESFFHVYEDLPFLNGPAEEQRRKFSIWQLQQELSSKPGEYEYSNGGYVIAAAIMEEYSGKSWEELMKERLFKPLKMHSAIIGMPYQKDINQPWRHCHRAENGDPVPLPLSERKIPELFNPAGTVSLNIKDFARYAIFNLRGLAGEDGILKSESVQFLHEPIIEAEEGQFYALGWGVRWYDETKVSGHSGGDQSLYAVIGIDHQNLHAVLVLCNMGDQLAESACANVMVEIMP